MRDEKNIKAVIVDDAGQARELLRLMLRELAIDVQVVGEGANVPQAIELIRKHRPDVVFLDIEMPGKSGLQLVEEISREDMKYEIIFTTAYNQYAIRAFRLSAIDYLLKPIDERQLLEAVEKVRKSKSVFQSEQRLQALQQNLATGTEATVNIPTLNGYLFLPANDILYIKADGAYTHVFAQGRPSITVSKNLKYFEGVLDGQPQFVRVHRSCLINMKHIKKYDRAERGALTMSDETVIDVARERRAALFNALGI
jgi:two-component system LytT family response regulator